MYADAPGLAPVAVEPEDDVVEHGRIDQPTAGAVTYATFNATCSDPAPQVQASTPG